VWTDLVATGVVNSNTDTVPSEGTLTTTLSQVPGAPAGLTAVATDGQVDLSWSPPADQGASPVTDYIVYAYASSTTSNGPGAKFDTHSTSTTYTWVNLGSPRMYAFTVQAVNGAGYGSR
jgi:large repetitive protein